MVIGFIGYVHIRAKLEHSGIERDEGYVCEFSHLAHSPLHALKAAFEVFDVAVDYVIWVCHHGGEY